MEMLYRVFYITYSFQNVPQTKHHKVVEAIWVVSSVSHLSRAFVQESGVELEH